MSRLEELDAEIREVSDKIERLDQTGNDLAIVNIPMKARHLDTLLRKNTALRRRLHQLADERGRELARIDQAGRHTFTRDELEGVTAVATAGGAWHHVVRVNTKTVTIDVDPERGWQIRIPFKDVFEVHR